MNKIVLGFCMGFFISCAALTINKLQNRTLEIHKSGRLYYDYCSKKNIFGFCKEWTTDFYDLADPNVRNKLHGFICKHRSRQY